MYFYIIDIKHRKKSHVYSLYLICHFLLYTFSLRREKSFKKTLNSKIYHLNGIRYSHRNGQFHTQ